MKVRELFVRSPRMTNKCVLNSGRKIPWKKFSGYVEVTFNISPLSSGQYSQKCFLRIFSKTLVWTIQCSFKQSFPNSFWKSSRYFSLRSRKKPSKFQVSKPRDIFFEYSTLDKQDAVLKNPLQNIQKIWNWQKFFLQENSLKDFLWTLWMLFCQTCVKNSIENPKKFKKFPKIFTPFSEIFSS